MVCQNFRFLQFDLKLEKKKTQFTRGRFNFWSEEFAWLKENTGKSWCKDWKTSNWKLLSNKNCYGQVQLKFHQSISPLAMFIGKCKVHISWEGHKIYEIFPLLLTKVHTVKSKGKISQNFVTFLEYMNFTSEVHLAFNFRFNKGKK